MRRRMHAPLAPCPACSRHVKLTDARCPFCASALPPELAAGVSQHSPEPPRLSRSAMLLAGAAFAVGCDRYTSTAEIYGSPPRPPVAHTAQDASVASAHADASTDVTAPPQGNAAPSVK